MRESYSRLMDVVYIACMWIAGLSLAMMSLIIPWAVFTRYVLDSGTSWAEPLAIMFMMVFTFLGAAVAYRANCHIAVAMLTDRVPAGARELLEKVVDLLMAALSVFIVVYGYDLSVMTWNQFIAELPELRVGITYMTLPIGSAVTLLFVIERILCGPQNERPVCLIGSEEKPRSIDDLRGEEPA
jgi:TRAP-type C4-dicarboxylate transport system permease small subunit